MKLNPPTVLLHHTFLAAVSEPDHPQHDAAISTYLMLVDEFETNSRLLAATSDDIEGIPAELRRSLFAPVSTLHVAAQHRSAARAMPEHIADANFATTLVMAHRERVAAIATFDPRFHRFDIDVLPAVQLSI